MNKTVGIIGAGQMGSGIAQVAATSGYRVLLADVDRERAEQAIQDIAKRLSRLVAKDKLVAYQAEAALP